MSPKITTENAGYAYDIVKKICIDVGPGLPGSAQDSERATIIQKELQAHLDIENVEVEEFSFASGAFLSIYPFCRIFLSEVGQACNSYNLTSNKYSESDF